MKKLRELDAQLAELVMKWTYVSTSSSGNRRYEDKNGDTYIIAMKSEYKFGRPWHPTEQIDAAFQVVERLRELGWHLMMNDTGGEYRARFWQHGKWSVDDWIRAPDGPMTVWEETPALAICRAALSAVSCTQKETEE